MFFTLAGFDFTCFRWGGGGEKNEDGGRRGRGGYSTICMPVVGWLTGRLLSIPDEGPPRGEDKKMEYLLK